MTDHRTCFYCTCPATHWSYWHRAVGWCDHHYRHGGDLPCLECRCIDTAPGEVA